MAATVGPAVVVGLGVGAADERAAPGASLSLAAMTAMTAMTATKSRGEQMA
jgi:hypothetical protein